MRPRQSRHLLSRPSTTLRLVIAENFPAFHRNEATSPIPGGAHRDKTGSTFTAVKQSVVANGAVCAFDIMERDKLGLWGSGDGQPNSVVSGLDRLKHPGLNKVTHTFQSKPIKYIKDNYVIFLHYLIVAPYISDAGASGRL